jgi:hypothetical protein
MNGNIGWRIASAFVLVAVIAGIAFYAFQAGVAKGSPVTIEAPSGQTAPAPYPYYGYGMPFYRPWGFGFGFLGFLIPLFLFFIALRAFRFLFWGPRWGYRGPWRHRWSEGGAPPMFEEWHKRAHGESSEEKKES